MSNPFQPLADWAYKKPELEKKVALNQVVHRTLDRGQNRAFMGNLGYEGGSPPSEIKSALMTPTDERGPAQVKTLKKFKWLQNDSDNLTEGLQRGWTPDQREKHLDEYGSYPGANDYSPGDQEYNKRLRGIDLTNALLGPAEKTKQVATGTGVVMQKNYDPRDQAFDRYIDNPNTRPLLTPNEEGSYATGENLGNALDNYHMGAGRVLKPLGQRGWENMHRYYNSRGEEDESTSKAFLKGTGEMLLDTTKAAGRRLGFDIPYSERDQAVQSSLAAQWLSDSGTQMFDKQDMEVLEDGTSRQELAEAYESIGEEASPMSVPDSFKLATGRMPNVGERLYNEVIPMLADYSTAVAPMAAAAFGQKGFGNALKAGLTMLGHDMTYEELPTNSLLTGASIFATGQQEKSMGQLREIAERKKRIHRELGDSEMDFANRVYEKLHNSNQMQ